MKVICINNIVYVNVTKKVSLTINKVYNVEDIGLKANHIPDGMYYILNDKNSYEWYKPDRFITLEEFRNEKLNKILVK